MRSRLPFPTNVADSASGMAGGACRTATHLIEHTIPDARSLPIPLQDFIRCSSGLALAGVAGE
jgi:hypothetical protein